VRKNVSKKGGFFVISIGGAAAEPGDLICGTLASVKKKSIQRQHDQGQRLESCPPVLSIRNYIEEKERKGLPEWNTRAQRHQCRKVDTILLYLPACLPSINDLKGSAERGGGRRNWGKGSGHRKELGDEKAFRRLQTITRCGVRRREKLPQPGLSVRTKGSSDLTPMVRRKASNGIQGGNAHRQGVHTPSENGSTCKANHSSSEKNNGDVSA